jgi:hypothetical protein
MPNSKFLLLSVLLAIPSGVFAQASLSASHLGLVFDERSRALRPIVGYPGAAILGEPLLTNLDNAYASPDGNWVLVDVGTSEADASSRILRLNGDLAAALPMRKQAIWSQDSKHLALLARDGSVLEWYALADSGDWIKRGSHSFVEGSGGVVRLLALDGQRLRLWFRSESQDAGGSLSLLRLESDSVESINQVGDPVALAVPRGPDDELLVASGRSGGVQRLFFRDGAWQTGEVLISGNENGELRFLCVLEDKSFLVVREQRSELLQGISRWIEQYSGSGELQKSISLEAAVDGFVPVVATKWIRLQSRVTGEEAIFLYDLQERDLFFVPAPSIMPAGQEELQ